MLLRRVFFAIVITAFVSKSFAQVNLQTGSATFSLPIFNWKDNKSNLFSGVALDYNSGNGLKVNDVASNVGQGWNIVAGGVITRMQIGEPDDQHKYGQLVESDITKYPNGYLYADMPASSGCPKALTQYPIYGDMNRLYSQHNAISEDKQIDYFTFQFNGKAGMFIVDFVNGNGVGYSLGDSKMKITFQTADMTGQGIRTTITSFQIQDVDGLIYKFTKQGMAKIMKDEYCDRENWRIGIQPKFDNGESYVQAGFDEGPSAAPWTNAYLAHPWVVTNWYLTEIEDALTHRKINLTYNVYSIINSAGTDIICNEPKDYTVITMKRSQTMDPKIATISFPDGHTVTFNYGADRVDLTGDKVLSSVDVQYQSRYLSRYKMNTSYFIKNRYGTPSTTDQIKVARLCLRSVTKIGVDLKEDTPPYYFDYYTGVGGDDCVPLPFSFAKDIWGFYNGDYTKKYDGTNFLDLTKDPRQLDNNEAKGLCFLRSGSSNIVLNPKNGYAKNGLLKQIIYPTGGTLGYEYEQNYGKLTTGGTEQMVGGVHVSKTLSTDGGYSNGCGVPITTKYDYVMNGAGSASSLWGLETPVRSISSTNYYAADKRYRKWGWSCPTVCCDYRFKYPGILSLNQTISLTQSQHIMQVLAPVLGIVSTVSSVVNIISLFCAGSVVMAWVSIIVEVIGGVITLILTCKDRTDVDEATTYFNTDLNGAAPLPGQFKRVEVTEGTGTIGKTVTEFTNEDDYAVWYPGTNVSLASKQRFAPWAYGLPKLITVYDASGNMVKQTKNIYDYNFAKTTLLCDQGNNTLTGSNIGKQKGDDNIDISLASVCRVSTKCFVQKSYSQRNDFWADPAVYNATYYPVSNADILVDAYNLYTGRVMLDSSYERVYKQNSNTQYLETTAKYYYNTLRNYDVNTVITIQSNGDKNIKTIKYANDYCCMPISNAMANANMVSVPVETKTWVVKSGGTAGYLNETVTEFTQLGSGAIRPSQIMEQRFAQPASSLTEYGGPGGSTANYKITQGFFYDAAYNLAGLKDESGRMVSNVYSYNDKYVVGSVINADPITDMVAYTSFESGESGKWTQSGGTTTFLYNPTAITGVYVCPLSGGRALNASLTLTKAYTLSFWSSTNTISVSSGSTLTKSGPTYNGFTYYEYDITSGTSSVTVAGTGNIDELRLYPKTSRMRTVAYDPLIGKTSECDENNRITYYEYDNLGRLQFIKDEGRNIVKMYEYNNVSPTKQSGCPATFYSKLTAETFYKNSCGAGYLGGAVVFTIPANKYTSTISQEAADLQAEQDMLTNGQAYANTNGTCKQIFYNTLQSGSFITQTCSIGYKGQAVTFSVPANLYSSLISVADANAKAQVEIAANGQVYANKNPSCIIDNDPQWIWDDVNAYCLTINGQLPAHQFLLFKDINPSSPTYNQTQWRDVGPQDECPANTYFSAERNQAFTKACSAGYTGSSVNYRVPPGKYSSTVSQSAADQLAINDVNANGQNYANANGTCTLVTPPVDCPITWNSSLTPVGVSSVSSTGGTGTPVNFVLRFTSSAGNYTGGPVCNVGVDCRPSVQRTFSLTENGRNWNCIVNNSGDIYISPGTGNGGVPTGSAVNLTGSYTK